MIIILIHWLIKKNYEDKFIKVWEESLSVPREQGLYREILATPDVTEADSKYQTFSLESPHYSTYINIGIWKSLNDFERLVGSKYIPKVNLIDGKQIFEIEDFEFKIRERVILKVISDRGTDLPLAKLAF